MRLLLYTILLIFQFLCIPFKSISEPKIGTEQGNRAPVFQLTSLNNDKISTADFRGKIVLLNFWSTLCAPCTAEMPALNRLYHAFSQQGFIVLAVSIDKSEKPVKEFVNDKKIDFPVLMDSEKEVFFDDFAGPSLPASYLIGKDGIIIETFHGPQEWDSQGMMSKISKLVDRKR